MIRRFQRKYCKFCAEKKEYIDFRDYKLLRTYMTERGKILPRRMTGTCHKHQHQLTIAIKQARNLALLPFMEK